jgi:hypothetical protein
MKLIKMLIFCCIPICSFAGDKKTFDVERLSLSISLGSYDKHSKGGNIKIADVLESYGLLSIARYNDPDYPDQGLTSQVTCFKVMIVSNLEVVYSESLQGSYFSKMLKEQLKKIQPGDLIILYDAEVKIIGTHLILAPPRTYKVIN